MNITEISKRHIMFTDDKVFDVDLNLHLILADKYNYIIDSGLGSEHINEILDFINLKDYARDKENILINTHFHWDHIWGNHVLKDNIIIGHKNIIANIEMSYDKCVEKYQKFIVGETKKCLPNLVFDETLEFKTDLITLFHTPGHSDDGISIYDAKEKVLIAGDNIGDTMEEPLPYYECSDEEYLKSVMLYKELDFDTLISGHNKILGKEFIDTIIEEVNKKINSKNK